MIEAVVRRGTLLTVIVLVIGVLGTLSVLRIPAQMIPDLEVREISVVTTWPGATPQDVEKEILIEQEEFLRAVPNLARLLSSATTGQAQVELEFPFGTDITQALIDVNNALSQVPAYPETVNEPRVTADSFSSNAFMYYRITPLPGNPLGLDMNMMQDFIDDNVRTRMERVPGVSQVTIGGGAERQIQILVDPQALADRQVTPVQIRNAVRARNRDFSGGDVNAGKRRYLLRTVGRFNSLTDLEDLIVSQTDDAIVRLSDVAEVRFDHFEIRRMSFAEGVPTTNLAVSRVAGSNVIDIKRGLQPVVAALNRDVLQPNGMVMGLTSDDVQYVEQSIRNVWKNLTFGAVLATLIMFVFLRSVPATAIGIVGIPICAMAAFMGLLLFGRTVNVISLAGVAFAIGMTLDNSIVVLEAIERARRRGLDRVAAAVAGVRQVWSAVLASTLTTVLVFAPILFIEEEAGQLYSDVAIAISASILMSMIVAVTVVPTASARVAMGAQKHREQWPLLERMIRGVDWLVETPVRRWSTLISTLVATLFIIVFLTPSAEYLPEGEEPKVFGAVIPPPGYSLNEMELIAHDLHRRILPYVDDDPKKFSAGEAEIPALAYINLGVTAGGIRMLAQTINPGEIDELIPILTKIFRSYPGMRAFIARGSIISSNDGGTRSVNVDVAGSDLAEIYDAAQTVYARAAEILPDAQIGSTPSSLTLNQPLIEVRPNWSRVGELGLETFDIGYALAAMSDGAFVDEFFLDDDKIDIYLYSETTVGPGLDALPDSALYVGDGTTIPLSAVAEFVETTDTDEIRRVNGQRTVTLNIVAPRSLPLEEAVQIVRRDVIGALQRSGEISSSVSLDISGAADQLDATKQALLGNFVVALLLSYLLLVAIFNHWGYPLIIMTIVPLGVAGGILGLVGLNVVVRQPFDMISMLGFLILLGTVVNNPILIVDRTLSNLREQGMGVKQAVSEAVATRIRPILMSMTTTVCGLAPLVFIPGAGTELYRGVGVIVLAGLVFATLLTLTLLPVMLTTLLGFRKRGAGLASG